MAKPEWGTKRKCLSCGALFYDMKKKEFSCPKCGQVYSVEEIEKQKLEAALKSVNNIKALEQEMDEEEMVASVVNDVDLQDEDDESELLDTEADMDDEKHDMDSVMSEVATTGKHEE